MGESTRSGFIAKASLLGLAGLAASSAYALLGCDFFSNCFINPSSEVGISRHDDDDPQHYEDLMAKIQMLDKLQHYPGLDVFGALRIPSSEGKEQKDFDIVILTKRKLCILDVKNWRGTIKSDIDGSWCQTFENGLLVRHGNIVEEVKNRSMLLEAYLSRRGLELPSTFIDIMVVLANVDSRLDETILGQSQVFSLQQLEVFLRKESSKSKTCCAKLKIPRKRMLISRDLYAQLHSILCTVPLWDRITLEGGAIMLGDFIRFDGCDEDMEALKLVKRSCVREMRISINHKHKSRLLRKGLILKLVSLVDIRCIIRDYRANASRRNSVENGTVWNATVSGDIDVIFRCLGTCTPQIFKLSTLIALELSA